MPIKIIAEAGSNHNGDIKIAKTLVDKAVEAGADYVKFQIINPDTLYVPFYWDKNEKVQNPVHSRRKSESLTFNEWSNINDYALKKGIRFTASIFDEAGADFLKSINAPFIKLASSDLNNLPLIKYIAKLNIPTILSTGMANLEEIKLSVDTFKKYTTIDNLSLLHCVSVYPCKLEKTRLYQIDILKSEFNCKVGFSDHTMNSISACVAVTKGIHFVEKHFTLDKTMDGFDHKYASDLNEFKGYVSNIRSIERSLFEREIKTGEEVTKVRARRGIYLNKALKKDDKILREHISIVRPSNGLNPKDIDRLEGLFVGEEIREFEALEICDNKVYPDKSFNWKNASTYWSNEMREKKML